MKYIKVIFSFYNNCIEIPRKDFTEKFPKFAELFDYLYLLIFILNLLFISSILSLFSKTISELFALFCLPIFITFLIKMSYKDFFDK